MPQKAGVPKENQFRTEPETALDWIRAAYEAGLPRGVVLMDVGYGANSDLRADLTALDLTHVAAILPTPPYGLLATPSMRSNSGSSFN